MIRPLFIFGFLSENAKYFANYLKLQFMLLNDFTTTISYFLNKHLYVYIHACIHM